MHMCSTNKAEMMKYVTKIADATAKLSDGESQFKGVCSQLAMGLEVIHEDLTDTFGKAANDGISAVITDAQSMLRQVLTQAINDLVPLRHKLSEAKRLFAELQMESTAYANSIRADVKRLQSNLGGKAVLEGLGGVAMGVGGCVPAAAVAAGFTVGTGAPVVMAICVANAGSSAVEAAVSIAQLITSEQHCEAELEKQATNFDSLSTSCRCAFQAAKTDYDNLIEVKARLNNERVIILYSTISAWQSKVLPSITDLIGFLKEKAK